VTVVFFSDIAWDSLYQRPQHIASRLARSAAVLWVEPATLGRRVLFTPVEQSPGVFRMTLPAFPLNARNRWIRRAAWLCSSVHPLRALAAAAQRTILRRAMRRVNPAGTDTVCLVENFLFMHLAEALKPRRVVFDYIDDAFGFTSLPVFVKSAWLAAVTRADEVTVTSPTLRRRVLDVRARDVRLIPNGVEFERFALPARDAHPVDLPPGGSPVVGYVGSIYPWVDFELLDRTLDALADLRFVMIGHCHPDVAAAMERLSRHVNFRYLGLKPYGEIPAYMKEFAAGIIPFRRTLLTEAVNPVKLYEYSAAGVPTVATDFSDDTRAFGDIVLIGRTDAEFAQHIRTAVTRRGDRAFGATLLAFAKANDWESRANSFSDLLQLHGS
jgi:glycosyltransferase involved in cell wall biosynthesis